MQSNKGVYALLLGSGISRAAGIPTGWDIILELVRRIGGLARDDCPDPVQYYRDKFGEEPNYSKLLDSLVKSQAERSNLLWEFFEPTDSEREQGLKIPTAAHRAIAELVAKGYIRVILTTNFDRLLEQALAELGVVASVIYSADDISGAMPIEHTKCTVIKVNGDYVDTRIRNTDDELAAYGPELNAVLRHVFENYGLVICGWSGEWDIALRDAIRSCPVRRFSAYWASLGEPADRTKELLEFRKAEQIRIEGADAFFRELREKVFALE
jgi:hypothetical protein